MLNCIAIDDEPLALRQIKSYIDRHSDLNGVGFYSDAQLAYEELDGVDLILCDIEMPALNGLTFIETLVETKEDHSPMVIFTTAYSEYAVDGFRLEAIDYLLKPISYEAFSRSVGRAVNLYELKELNRKNQSDSELIIEDEQPHCLNVKSGYKVEKIVIDEIAYIESEGEYIRFMLPGGRSVVTLYRLKNIENELPATKFVRIHRSYIVNVDNIQSYDRTHIELSDGVELPIGQSYRKAVAELLK